MTYATPLSRSAYVALFEQCLERLQQVEIDFPYEHKAEAVLIDAQRIQVSKSLAGTYAGCVPVRLYSCDVPVLAALSKSAETDPFLFIRDCLSMAPDVDSPGIELNVRFAGIGVNSTQTLAQKRPMRIDLSSDADPPISVRP